MMCFRLNTSCSSVSRIRPCSFLREAAQYRFTHRQRTGFAPDETTSQRLGLVAFRESSAMTFNRTMLVIITLVIAAIAIGTFGVLLQQRKKAGTIEIQINKDGMRIERN